MHSPRRPAMRDGGGCETFEAEPLWLNLEGWRGGNPPQEPGGRGGPKPPHMGSFFPVIKILHTYCKGFRETWSR